MKRFYPIFMILLAVALMSCGDGGHAGKQLAEKVLSTAAETVEKQLDGAEAKKTDTSVEGSTAPSTESEAWQVVGLPKAGISVSEQVLERTGYVASYNKDWRIPNWVMWRLTAAHTTGPYKRDGVNFTPDEDVSNSPTTYDYQRTGYDRGHMCPSADNRWSEQAQQDCFLMTNICPQNHNLNTGDWNEMETQCRKWAERYGEIYVICGPILFKGTHKKIAKSIVVPEAFFKVVYCPSTKKAIGFIYRNEARDRPKGDYVNTVDQVERITGYDFFPSLPKDVQDVMEADAELSDWGL